MHELERKLASVTPPVVGLRLVNTGAPTVGEGGLPNFLTAPSILSQSVISSAVASGFSVLESFYNLLVKDGQ
ncbi:MAG: hypothetical protein IPQ19_16405 [Bacteroidetes bacterium]|nr:hypothetical protein [Bacteroidota bacterium]